MENTGKDFSELAANRYSIHKPIGKPVEQEDLNKTLKAGYPAPTACNRQPQRTLVINSDEGRAKLKRCTKCHLDAPTALLIYYDKTDCWQHRYDDKISGDIGAGIITTHVILEAIATGVGTTWVMHFDPAAVKSESKVPGNYELTTLLIVGYPAPDTIPYPNHSEYRSVKEMVFYYEF